MTNKPYESITRIAALASKQGHVVGVEDDKTTIETGTHIVNFHRDRSITDSAGAALTMEQALSNLKIKLT